jgi:hypothetical protein
MRAGELLWSVRWGDVLSPELRGQPCRPADHVSVHLRSPVPPRDIKCMSAAQAQQLNDAVHRHLASLLRVRLLDTDQEGTPIEEAGVPQHVRSVTVPQHM